ncbi:MAG: MBL fold metallo-hydrolase [bacterium]
MKIKFCGAAQNVTGSKHLLQIGEKKVLLDCGLFQGNPRESAGLNRHWPFDIKEVSHVVLSHGHLDHCGGILRLAKEGWKGKVWCTEATKDVVYWILKDAAYIQQGDYEYAVRKAKMKAEDIPEPLFGPDDVDTAMELFETIPYQSWTDIEPNIRVKMYDAGHILGSSVIALEYVEDGVIRRLGFSGDLGRKKVPILRDPQVIEEDVDIWIMESTYGDRLHASIDDLETRLVEVIKKAVERKAKIICPAFSLGRTQELIYVLHKLTDEGKLPRFPMYVDSPLAGSITTVFGKHLDLFDNHSRVDFLNHGDNPFGFRNLTYTRDKTASEALNGMPGPMLIISASGMANAGRVLHHLKHNVSDPNNMVLITGFMAKHTLGRSLVEKEPTVRIFGESYPVRAEIQIFNEFSAHADYQGLIDYTLSLKGIKKIFLVHGEAGQTNILKARLENLKQGWEVIVPAYEEEFIV